MKLKKIFIILPVLLLANILPANAMSLAQSLKGRILLDVERNGEAWYVYPQDLKRYYLGRPTDAFKVMRELGLGISEVKFQTLAKSDMPLGVTGDTALAKSLSGRIILEVEKNGEAWYVNPADLRIYYLGRPADAFAIMRKLSLGISRLNLALIHKNTVDESINQYSSYEHKKITVNGVDFSADIVSIDLADPKLEIITDTANKSDCDINCAALPLGAYVARNDAFAALNGTYFDTSSAKRNYYFFPVWNSQEKVLINEDQLKYWTTGPIMAFDSNNKFYYFKDSREFGSVKAFEEKYGTKLQAAIGNKPRLIEEGMNQLIIWEVDPKQRDEKAIRNALAYRKDPVTGKETLLLVALHNATVPELAEALKVLKVDYAINIDGGSSTALWYNDEYMIAPGRNIPNAILFRHKDN